MDQLQAAEGTPDHGALLAVLGIWVALLAAPLIIRRLRARSGKATHALFWELDLLFYAAVLLVGLYLLIAR